MRKVNNEIILMLGQVQNVNMLNCLFVYALDRLDDVMTKQIRTMTEASDFTQHYYRGLNSRFNENQIYNRQRDMIHTTNGG